MNIIRTFILIGGSAFALACASSPQEYPLTSTEVERVLASERLPGSNVDQVPTAALGAPGTAVLVVELGRSPLEQGTCLLDVRTLDLELVDSGWTIIGRENSSRLALSECKSALPSEFAEVVGDARAPTARLAVRVMRSILDGSKVDGFDAKADLVEPWSFSTVQFDEHIATFHFRLEKGSDLAIRLIYEGGKLKSLSALRDE